MNDKHYLIIGKISGVFGVKGWVKVFSFTEPKENILNYQNWLLKKGTLEKTVTVVSGQAQGKTVVANLLGIDDRDKAAALSGWDILIERTQLPPVAEDEFYWVDLVGLKVITTLGVDFGVVDHLLETGANDVLVVIGERERLVPFLRGQSIVSIDLAQGLIVVDWDPEF